MKSGEYQTIKLNITQNDIDNGTKNSLTHCPIALAYRRQMNFHDGSLRVYPSFLITNNKSYLLGKEASKFIKNFDAGKIVKTTTITLK